MICNSDNNTGCFWMLLNTISQYTSNIGMFIELQRGFYMMSELQSRFNEGFVSLSMVQDSLQYTNIHGREHDYTSITGVHKSVIPHALLHGCCEIYSGSAAPLHQQKRSVL